MTERRHPFRRLQDVLRPWRLRNVIRARLANERRLQHAYDRLVDAEANR